MHLRTFYFVALVVLLVVAGSAVAGAATPSTVFPSAATTGPSGTLTSSGSITVTTPGAVIENRAVTGVIQVRAPNVTIRNVRINATSRYAIHVLPEANSGTQRTVIENVEVVGGMAEGRCNYAIVFGEYVARRVDITRCGNGFWAGGNTTIEDSYIHGMRDLSDDHSDGVQSTQASNVIIRRNNIVMDRAMTSAILMHAHFGPLRNIQIIDNRLAGGGYTLNMYERGYSASGIVIRGNVWEAGSYAFGPRKRHDFFVQTSKVQWSGNMLTTGAPLAA